MPCADIIDKELKTKHTKLSEKIEEVITDPMKAKVKLKKENVDIAYPPIVQSGGDYNLKVSAQSTDKVIKYDVILISVGTRYNLYCSNIARTYLVDPSKTQEAEYGALLEAQEAAIKSLVEGAPLSAPYKAVVDTLEVSCPA